MWGCGLRAFGILGFRAQGVGISSLGLRDNNSLSEIPLNPII